MYVATGGPNVKWGGTDFKWGAGHHWPPRWRRPWAMVLGLDGAAFEKMDMLNAPKAERDSHLRKTYPSKANHFAQLFNSVA